MSPHKSLIWDYFGTKGIESNDFCVTDGPFKGYLKNGCIKREWNKDGTISPWYCPDLETLGFNSMFGNSLMVSLFMALGVHFRQHLKWNAFQTHGLKTLEDSVCNPRCRPQPSPPTYTSDDNNRRQLKAYKDEWNYNLAPAFLTSDNIDRTAMTMLNTVGYCSPFVTSNTKQKKNVVFGKVIKGIYNVTSSLTNWFRELKIMVSDLEAGLNEIMNKNV